MTLDPQTHKIYLATAKFEGSASRRRALPQRPKAIPGSFKSSFTAWIDSRLKLLTSPFDRLHGLERSRRATEVEGAAPSEAVGPMAVTAHRPPTE